MTKTLKLTLCSLVFGLITFAPRSEKRYRGRIGIYAGSGGSSSVMLQGEGR